MCMYVCMKQDHNLAYVSRAHYKEKLAFRWCCLLILLLESELADSAARLVYRVDVRRVDRNNNRVLIGLPIPILDD